MLNQLKKILGFAMPAGAAQLGKAMRNQQIPQGGPAMGNARIGGQRGGSAMGAAQIGRQQARPMLPKAQAKSYIDRQGNPVQFFDNPTNAGDLNPAQEDGFDTTIANIQGNTQVGKSPFEMDAIPQNYARYRTGFYQGSNPFTSRPTQNIYPNVNPNDMDAMATGGMIQSPDFGQYTRKRRF